MKLHDLDTNIRGLKLLKPQIHRDKRGWFTESFSEREAEAICGTKFVQDNTSFSFKGVLRGLHFQKEHAQAKLVRVIKGEVFDVAVDLRQNSPTKNAWHAVLLDGDLGLQFYIPAGFAHGFIAMTDAILSYKCSDYYYPDDDYGVRWDDSTLGVKWPLYVVPGPRHAEEKPIISSKDEKLPLLSELSLGKWF